jgi:hypothetical protein
MRRWQINVLCLIIALCFTEACSAQTTEKLIVNDTWTEVEALIAVRSARSDAEVLAEFEAMPPLDETSATSEDVFWKQATLYLALSEICAVRRLKAGARLILEKGDDGDPGSIMRGMRHALERIYNPDWAGLAQVCIDAFKSGLPGAKVWAMSELRILEQPFARPLFEDILQRKDIEYVSDAEQGIARLDVMAERAARAEKSDTEILAELAAIPPVVDEADPSWTTGRYWVSDTWKAANVFEALTDIATTRQLKPAIDLLFTKTSNGNPRGLMSGLHYNLAQIVGEDWKFLQDAAHQAAQSTRAATRYWGIEELVWGQVSSYDYPPAREVFVSVVQFGPEALKDRVQNVLDIMADREREKASGPQQ